MKVTLGSAGLTKTWQDKFPKTVTCACGAEARPAFVAHEGLDEDDKGAIVVPPNVEAVPEGEPVPEVLPVPQGEENPAAKWVCELHHNEGKGGYWLHDFCAVAVYICPGCFALRALYNQG